jgi:hypothetical protein
MAALAARAKREGFARWMLNVKPENVAARALYERVGMQVTLESVSMRIEWVDVARLPLRDGTQPRALAAADDARFEEALGAPTGEIASYRALDRILSGLERLDDGTPLGFLAFDPSFPGASPFRVRRPEHARALLESIRAHALPELGHMLLFVEGDPALEAVLTAAGGRPAMRVLRMEGDVPS